jgi:hypothetical protein
MTLSQIVALAVAGLLVGFYRQWSARRRERDSGPGTE